MSRQTATLDIRRIVCPKCKQRFSEFYDQETYHCPECGETLTNIDDSTCETKEVVIYLDQLTEQVSTEVA